MIHNLNLQSGVKSCQTFFLKYNNMNILFEKSFDTVVNPSSHMAFENLLGSAPPVLGSNLLFTSAINSHPL